MSPTCSRAALRLLTSFLLASSIANAIALPRQVLDPREAVAEVAEFPAAQISAALRASVENDPDNVFDDVEKIFKEHTALDLIKDFFARLFGWDNDGDQDDDEAVTTTVFVTPTPVEVASSIVSNIISEITSVASSEAVAIPPGPSLSVPMEVSSDLVVSNTSAAATIATSEPTDDLMSILPVGSLTTAINLTIPEPVFETGAPELEPSTFAVLLPPFPVNTTVVGPLPTAVLITDEFTAIPPGTGLPIGTGLPYPWPGNDSVPVVNPTLILTNPLRPTDVPSINETVDGTATITANLTSVVVVTATVIPLPVGTGDVSVGTGLPAFTDAATGLYPNTTIGIPTPILSTGGALQGTGLSNVTALETPLFPNTTSSDPTPILSTGDALQGTGISNATAVETPIFPNVTTSESMPILSTGDALQGTGISNATTTDVPLFSNTTIVIPTLITVTGGAEGILNATVAVTVAPFVNTTVPSPTPILGTGSPDSSNVTVTFTDIPLFPNATLVLSTVVAGTGAPIAATGTGAPISFTEAPVFTNTTGSGPSVLPGTGTGVPSAGVTSAIVIIDPIFPNLTTTTTTTTLVGTGVSILPSGTGVVIVPSQAAVEFPGLLALRSICKDPQVRVVTLPLLSRFYGPGGYPSLFEFPGCTAPNSRQAEQAPGLLNCTALGAEVQRCQASGRKVLLSIKADGLDAVGGNADFGAPGTPAQPFGPYAVDTSAAAGETFDDDSDEQEKRKRQIGLPPNFQPPRLPLAPAAPTVSAVVNSILAALNLKPSSVPATPARPSSIATSSVSVSSSINPAIFPPLVATPLVIASPIAIEAVIPSSSVTEPVFPLVSSAVSTSVGEPLELSLVASTSSTSWATSAFDDATRVVISEPTEVPVESPEDMPIEPPNWSDMMLGPHMFAPTPIYLSLPPDLFSALPTAESPPLLGVESVLEPSPVVSEPVVSVEEAVSTPTSEPIDLVLVDPMSESVILVNDTAPEQITETSTPVIMLNDTVPTSLPAFTDFEAIAATPVVALPDVSNASAPMPLVSPLDGTVGSVPVATLAPTDILNDTVPVPAEPPVPNTESPTPPLTPFPISGPVAADAFPNLFNNNHPPTAFALTLFSLFGEGHTERSDLRPLGPEIDSPSSPAELNGTDWIIPPAIGIDTLSRPLGEEVVIDGFDVQVPVQWKGTYQDEQFRAFVAKLRQLNGQAWKENGAVEGGPGDLGADGRSVVYFGWSGNLLRRESSRQGWVEWDGTS